MNGKFAGLIIVCALISVLAAGCTAGANNTAPPAVPVIATTTSPAAPQTATVTTSQAAPSGTPVPFATAPDTPSATQYPDDLVPTPGGLAYRGNVIQQGQVNPWPHVDTAIVQFGTGNATGFVQYRADITTNPGQTRNNLVIISTASLRTGDHTLDLYAAGVPAGFTLGRAGGDGRPGQMGAQVFIHIAAGVAPGDYSFSLDIVLDGANYGLFPVTVHVVTQPVNTPQVPLSLLPSATIGN